MQRPKRQFLRRRPRQAFTLFELCMSLVILSLIAGAVGAMSLAVSGDWQEGDPAQSLQLQAVQGARRIDACIRPACYFGPCRQGSLDGSAAQPAALVFWQNDTSSPTGQVQLSEIAMIQHDPSSQTLMYYQAVFPANFTQTQINSVNKTYTYSAINVATAPEDFKSLPYVTGKAICHNVTGARFYISNVGSSTRRPSFDYALTLSRTMSVNGSTYQATQVQYGSATMRQPLDQPN